MIKLCRRIDKIKSDGPTSPRKWERSLGSGLTKKGFSTSIPKIKVNKSYLTIDVKGFRQGENRKIIELPAATENFCDDIDLDRPKSYF